MEGEFSGSSEAALYLRGRYKRDIEIELNPPRSSWGKEVNQSTKLISNFPYLKEFVNVSFIAYKDNARELSTSSSADPLKVNDIIEVEKKLATLPSFQESNPAKTGFMARLWTGFSKKTRGQSRDMKEEESGSVDVSKVAGVPEGFEFLTEANNNSPGNGYHGVAFINRVKRQIIVSHRGTKLSTLGALKTDLMSIHFNSHTPQVSSAMTFAYEVNLFARETGCQLFFTGHSLGAWLAQITCFSTKFLTIDDDTGHFVRKSFELWDDCHPYTVVFDSPGAYEFLLKMKDEMFPRNEAQSQGISVSCLPVEVYQFFTNSVNIQNIQIGSVYLVDLEKADIKYSYALANFKIGKKELNISKPFSASTHALRPVVNLVSKNDEDGASEEKVLRSRVVDFRVGKWDDFLHKWGEEGRSVPVQLNTFPEFFLTKKELEDLSKEKEKKEGGCYEGLSLEDEDVATRVVEYARSSGDLNNGMIDFGFNADRREVIPLLRHFTLTLKNKVIWWNRRKPKLPDNYIQRRIHKTHQYDYESDNEDYDDDDEMSLLRKNAGFLLLCDPPGMGKSTEVTNIQINLRKTIKSDRLVLRINLNEVQRALATISPGESVSSVLNKLAPFLPSEARHMESIQIFVLLDGVDEVCPKFEKPVFTLLHILHSGNESSALCIIVSSRPHLKDTLESEFNVKSHSLGPLTVKEQLCYMTSRLNLSMEQLKELRDGFPNSLRSLMKNPLMLFMLIDVLKFGEAFSPRNVNVFGLYTRFVDMKHKLKLVEKDNARPEDSSTETRVDSMLEDNLPSYFHVAWKELLPESDFPVIEKSMGVIARTPPASKKLTELLTFGLLIEHQEKGLVFKHRSFAEFFYARLLTQETPTPQILRDVLFGNIFAGEMSVQVNVEAFLVGAAATRGSDVHSQLLFPLSPKWLLFRDSFVGRHGMLRNFVRNSRFFPLLAREVLMSFVHGDDPDDLWEAYEVLLQEKSNGEAFRKLFEWMCVNKEWTRKELLQLNEQRGSTDCPQQIARLIIAISLRFGDCQLFTEEEVGVAVNSLNSRLIHIVASLQTKEKSKVSKFEWVERHVGGGRDQLKTLFQQMDAPDISVILEDMQMAWKLVEILSHEEICTLVTNEGTRVSDVIGERPLDVAVVFGMELVTPKLLAEFRGKFGEGKGKTIFEMDGREFALKLLWDDLVGEVGTEGGVPSEGGPVGVALREALGRSRVCAGELLATLETEVRRRRVGSCRRTEEGKKDEVGVVEWIVRGLQWHSTFTPFSFKELTLLLRYCEHVDHTHLTAFLHQNKEGLWNVAELKEMLRSLVIVSSLRSHDDHNLRLFSILVDFLHDTVTQTPSQWRSVAELFLGATLEEIRTASFSRHHFGGVCVGGVIVSLLATSKEKQTAPTIEEKRTWVEILVDVIETAPSCDLPPLLLQLRQLMEEEEEELKELLTKRDVLRSWKWRFSSEGRKEWEEFDACGLAHLLSFYFSVFGLNLDWMKMQTGKEVSAEEWILVESLPVEISGDLRDNPHWKFLLPQFQGMLGEVLREDRVVSVGEVDGKLFYKTEGEWETFLTLIDGEPLLPGIPEYGDISIKAVAPLIHVLISLKGVEWTKSKLTRTLWEKIPSCVTPTSDSVGPLGSLLHSAIQLGELEEVRRRSWPGLLLSWRNTGGTVALEMAKEMSDFENKHEIIAHLENLISSIQTTK